MITLSRASFQTVEKVAEFSGLATDEKPTKCGGYIIPNGSIFYEMDSQDTYMFDAENEEWIKQ